MYKTEVANLEIIIKPYFGTGLGIVCKKLQKWEDYTSKIMVSIWRLGTQKTNNGKLKHWIQ